MTVPWSDAVALRLVSLTLDGSGRLSDDLVLGVAVRGALLVDLALRHPTAVTGDALVADVRPTGFTPLDRLLGERSTSPVALLRRGRTGQADLAAGHVRLGSWTRHGSRLRPRYRDQRAERTQRDALDAAAPSGRPRDAADAALTAIAVELGVLGAGRERPSGALLQATGAARPLVELALLHVRADVEAATEGLGRAARAVPREWTG